MSAQRRRRDDGSSRGARFSDPRDLPGPDGLPPGGRDGRRDGALPGGGRPGEAWSAEFRDDPGERHRDYSRPGGRHADDAPGDPRDDGAWAGKPRPYAAQVGGDPYDAPGPGYRSAAGQEPPPGGDWPDGVRADEPWRDTSRPGEHGWADGARRDSDPVDEPWRADTRSPGRRAGEGQPWYDQVTGQPADDSALWDDRQPVPAPVSEDIGEHAITAFRPADSLAEDTGTHQRDGNGGWESRNAGWRDVPAEPEEDWAEGLGLYRPARDADELDSHDRAGRWDDRDSGFARGDAVGNGAGESGMGGRDPGDRDLDDWDDRGPGGHGRVWVAPGAEPHSRRRRVLISVAAAVAVLVALGGYGLVRQHDSQLQLRDAGGSPSPSARTAGPGGLGDGLSSSPAVSSPPAKHSPSASPKPARHSAPAKAPVRPPARPSASAPAGPAASSAAASAVLGVINQAREQAGLPSYTISSGLDTSSSRHTTEMVDGCGLSHQCPGEPSLGTRLTDAGVTWTASGENIGEGGPEADTSSAITQMAVELTQSMLNEQPPDDGHRQNILSSTFRFIGITVMRDSNGTVWMTQDFSN